MDIIETILHRRSIRKYTDEKVTDSQVEILLKAGMYAPSAVTQNILLAAHGTGLGAVWVGLYPRENRVTAVHRLFNLPAHVKPFSIISIGYPGEKKEFPDRFKKEKIHYEKW